MAVDGANSMMGAGLFIHRKTRVIMSIVLSCAALNIGLNFALIPRMGIVGSAIATLVSYSVGACALATAGRRLLRVPIPWTTVLRAGAVAGLMYVVISHVLPGHRLFTVIGRIALGAPIYVVLMTLVNADARALVRRPLERLRRLRGVRREAS
jgi:O-antigen/teichoic acid export membrane protein